MAAKGEVFLTIIHTRTTSKPQRQSADSPWMSPQRCIGNPHKPYMISVEAYNNKAGTLGETLQESSAKRLLQEPHIIARH